MSLLSDLLCAQCLLSQMQVHDSAQATISEVMHKARLAFDFMCASIGQRELLSEVHETWRSLNCFFMHVGSLRQHDTSSKDLCTGNSSTMRSSSCDAG